MAGGGTGNVPWDMVTVPEPTLRGDETKRPAPWNVSDAPEDYVQAMVSAIVGLEMPIARLVGKRKASQNRNEADRWGAAEDLRRTGQEAAASLIDT